MRSIVASGHEGTATDGSPAASVTTDKEKEEAAWLETHKKKAQQNNLPFYDHAARQLYVGDKPITVKGRSTLLTCRALQK